MEQNGGFQAPKDREDDDVFRIHWHPKHLILAEECLQTSNCRSLGLCQQKECQLQGDLVKNLQSYKRVDESIWTFSSSGSGPDSAGFNRGLTPTKGL